MKILFISLAVTKNLVDSRAYAGASGAGRHFTMTDSETEADVIVVNTCCFIGDAKEEVSRIFWKWQWAGTASTVPARP